jgi:hypothetical protein
VLSYQCAGKTPGRWSLMTDYREMRARPWRIGKFQRKQPGGAGFSDDQLEAFGFWQPERTLGELFDVRHRNAPGAGWSRRWLSLCGICCGAFCAGTYQLVAPPDVAHDRLAATTLANGHLAASFVTMTPEGTITITPAPLMLDVLRELKRAVDRGGSAGNARHSSQARDRRDGINCEFHVCPPVGEPHR